MLLFCNSEAKLKNLWLSTVSTFDMQFALSSKQFCRFWLWCTCEKHLQFPLYGSYFLTILSTSAALYQGKLLRWQLPKPNHDLQTNRLFEAIIDVADTAFFTWSSNAKFWIFTRDQPEMSKNDVRLSSGHQLRYTILTSEVSLVPAWHWVEKVHATARSIWLGPLPAHVRAAGLLHFVNWLLPSLLNGLLLYLSRLLTINNWH